MKMMRRFEASQILVRGGPPEKTPFLFTDSVSRLPWPFEEGAKRRRVINITFLTLGVPISRLGGQRGDGSVQPKWGRTVGVLPGAMA
jgi:hypothetical protein